MPQHLQFLIVNGHSLAGYLLQFVNNDKTLEKYLLSIINEKRNYFPRNRLLMIELIKIITDLNASYRTET